ncbi:MAG: hypothetical protein PHN37_01520 [Candidatus Pacebacteria bacterium]|nr:hypothetical protein [Candidatus Paceibacterota bacterium]
MLSKLLLFVKKHQSDIILIIGVILISLIAYAVGFLHGFEQAKPEIEIYE